MKNAIIIGAGIGGIAASIRLACKGYRVSVYESGQKAGGKLSEIMLNGFRFDTGPSLFTMAASVDELFILAGKNPREYLNYERLDEVCRYFYPDGTEFTASADIDKFSTELNLKLGEPKQNILNFLKKSAEMYEITEKLFLGCSLHKISTWLNPDALKGYLNIGKLEIFKTMDNVNSKKFINSKTVQLFNRYATYNGSDPYQTPATLNIIPHLEYNIGAYFPDKGMFGITKSLEQLAKEVGVDFFFESKVKEIVVENGEAKGVMVEYGTKKSFINSDLVVSNADVVNTYKNLLKGQKQPEKILSQPKSSSALIFYWGINKIFTELGLHNIFFSEDYKNEFEKIFKEKSISDDPTVYINVTSKLKNDDAPESCENWFVMINVPNNSGQNWDELINNARENIIKKLSKALKTNIKNLILCEQVLDPRSIESKTGSWEGALYGNSSNNKFAAFFRHPNFSRRINNLYFIGGSVHPGGGIPLALASAKITCGLIK